jgi:hypothetical protein
MKESKSLSGFEPTAVRGKQFEVNHLAMDTPNSNGLFQL